MSNITFIKGSLFDAPKGSILCHAVNCQGIWGGGIAAQFKKIFPEAYDYYNRLCKANGSNMIGSCLLAPDGNYTIGCLFTSVGFGSKVDSVLQILEATREAVLDLIFQNSYPDSKPIHMCKINSGLFGVPWELTEKILEEFGSQTFTVWEI